MATRPCACVVTTPRFVGVDRRRVQRRRRRRQQQQEEEEGKEGGEHHLGAFYLRKEEVPHRYLAYAGGGMCMGGRAPGIKPRSRSKWVVMVLAAVAVTCLVLKTVTVDGLKAVASMDTSTKETGTLSLSDGRIGTQQQQQRHRKGGEHGHALVPNPSSETETEKPSVTSRVGTTRMAMRFAESKSKRLLSKESVQNKNKKKKGMPIIHIVYQSHDAI